MNKFDRSAALWKIETLLLGVTLFCFTARATTKYVVPGGAGSYSGDDWDNAYSNIQSAVDACAAAGDSIYLKFGVYTNFSQIEITNRPGLTIQGGYLGDGTPGATTDAPSVITRDLSVRNRIFTCNVSTVTLDRVTITNGYCSNRDRGGGLALTNCYTTITNCTLANNMVTNATSYGGGIYVLGGTLTIADSVLCGNSCFSSADSSYGYGGGLYASAAAVMLSAVTFDRNTLTAVRGVYGGGMSLSEGSATIRDCTFTTNYPVSSGNSASYYTVGGALYASAVNPLTFSNCVFRRNYVTSSPFTLPTGGGGVMYLANVANVMLTDCRITENCDGKTVENLYINTAGSVSLRNSILMGGVSHGILKAGAGALSLTNCLIYANSGNGLQMTAGTVTVANCTLAGNIGWGLTNSAGTKTVIRDSIAWENAMGGIKTNGSVTATCTDSQEAIDGVGNMNVDPKFIAGYYLSASDLAYQTMNSPCIDAGSAPASTWGLDTRTTRTDGGNDNSGNVDLGYHADSGVSSISNLVLYVDVVNGNDSNNGWTPGTALKTIRAGLSNAIDGSTINIATGMYNQAAGESFPLEFQDVNLTIRGSNCASTVVDANGSNRVFTIAGKGRVWLEALTITNGWSGASTLGGGLFLGSCQTTITNCTLANNRVTISAGCGGGIYVSAGNLTVADSVLRGNYIYKLADSGDNAGGGLYASAAAVTLSAVTFDRNYVAVNGRNTYGGGVYLSGGSATIRDCTFITNYASSYGIAGYPLFGGALYASAVNPLTFSNCVFRRNYALNTLANPTGTRGGVMYLSGGSNTLTDCRITNNFGGAVVEDLYIDTAASSVSLLNSIFTGSYSNAIRKDGAGALSLTNCLIASNRSDGLRVAAGTVTVANCTLAGNAGWGLTNTAASGTLIRNSIAWTNTSGGLTTNGNVTVTYSDSQEAINGDGNLSADPLFADITTSNYRLSQASPCVNTGTNEAWMFTATDLDGAPRIRWGGQVDRGAYETEPPKGTVVGIR